jgi:ribonuclease P protein component
MCHYLRTTATGRVAVVVDKKVSKKATERNLVRRRLRAALREVGIPENGSLVIRALKGSTELSYQELTHNLRSCLRGVLS